MAKTIRKLRPTDYWCIGEHESWFTDMARKGWHLKKMGVFFAHFVQGEAKEIRYRIDVLSYNIKLTKEEKKIYAESGWEYVTSYGDFNVFSSPAELNAPELHTDAAEQSYTLEALDKQFSRNAILFGVVMILVVAMLSLVLFSDPAPILSLAEGRTLQQVIIVIVQFYLLYTSIKPAISMRALRKTLIEGKPINHNAPWKNQRTFTYAVFIIFLVCAIFATILPTMQLVLSKTETLPATTSNLPIVRLADVEMNVQLVQGSSSTQNAHRNSYTFNWSMLAPLQYQSNEQGIVANENWKDGSGKYSPDLNTWVYKLSFPSMKEKVVSDIIRKFGMKFKGGDFKRISNPDFDLLIVHEGDSFKEVVAAKGKGVIYVQYFGYADTNAIVESVGEKIALIEN